MSLIQERATLISVTIRRWHNQVQDSAASDQVDKINNADRAGKFLKHLVPPEKMKPIITAASAIRTNHYVYTLAWGDNGERLLPGKLVFEFTAKHKSFKEAYFANVDEFIGQYPVHKAAAPARLGKLYNPNDYPSPAELRAKFGVEENWGLVPDAKDFRVDVGEATAKHIREEIEASVNRRQAEAMKGCWDRMKEVVEKIHERLADEDAIFRDSLIDNAKLQVHLLSALNFMNDPDIEAMRKEVSTLLVPPQRLRDDKALRNDKAEEARKILEKMGALLP